MKQEDARKELKRVLKEQQTISIPKLRNILESMNVPLSKEYTHPEILYLKGRLLQKERELKKIKRSMN